MSNRVPCIILSWRHFHCSTHRSWFSIIVTLQDLKKTTSFPSHLSPRTQRDCERMALIDFYVYISQRRCYSSYFQVLMSSISLWSIRGAADCRRHLICVKLIRLHPFFRSPQQFHRPAPAAPQYQATLAMLKRINNPHDDMSVDMSGLFTQNLNPSNNLGGLLDLKPSSYLTLATHLQLCCQHNPSHFLEKASHR